MMTEDILNITETPRDGFQGLKTMIPTKTKVAYLNLLLQAGFDTVEVGSFVSPKAIPQMADTAKVLEMLDPTPIPTQIAVLVASMKGGQQAVAFDRVDKLFFPFAISPTFLERNIRQSTDDAERCIDGLQNLCVKHNKQLDVFLSMAFGNPYGDAWHINLLMEWVEKLNRKGLTYFPLSDIMGDARPDLINEVFNTLRLAFPDIQFGLHLHTRRKHAIEKVQAAYNAGIRHFDTVISGMGGCPMTGQELVGNLALQDLQSYCDQQDIKLGLNRDKIAEAEGFYQEYFQGLL